MAQVPYTSFYLGPLAVYNSPTGMVSNVTGIPYLGDTLHEGDYCDLSAAEAAEWNVLFGATLYPGRYRFVRLSVNATSANLGFGTPVGFGLGTTVAQAIVAAGGTGYTITATGASSGTVSISSSASGGTAVATATLTLSAGVITGAQITFPGAGFTSVPTFTLSSVLSGGSGGSVLARQTVNPNFISSFDSSCAELSTVRGVVLTPVTAAQISAGAWIVLQEQGIANVNVTAGTSIAAGGYVAATTAATVTASAAATSRPIGYFGDLLDLVGASVPQNARVSLNLAVQQG